MNDREAFEAWAPESVEWSKWAKPTLLASGESVAGSPGLRAAAPAPAATPFGEPGVGQGPQVPTCAELVWPLKIPGRSAVVLEMPGPLAVDAGLALRERGYWPVPLFNATHGPNPLVDVLPTLIALRRGAAALRAGPGQSMQGDAALLPCFLVDAGRSPRVGPTPGRYDNRSVVFPQDFPSGTLLRSHEIEQAVLVMHGTSGPAIAPDLAHVLHGWQRDGVRIMRWSPATEPAPRAAEVPRPGGFGLFWRRIITLEGLRRSAAGGFGAWTPEASTGGGYS